MKSLHVHQGFYSVIITGVLLVIVLVLPGTAQTLPRNEFNITLDLDGHIVSSPAPNPYSPSSSETQNTGYGDKWYFYPNSGRYIQWYYNDPYDPARKALLDVWIYMETVYPERPFILEVTYCWARPEWSLKGLNSPPLPIDIPDSNTEHMYIQSRSPIMDTRGIRQYLARGGSIEPHSSNEGVDGYNPEWIGISVSGVNAHVYRWMTIQCVVDEDDDGQEPVVFGACCNRQTGSCFQSTQMGCININPNIWLGIGTTCSECQQDSSKWDFGDAPQSYPVVLSADGARHIKQQGIYLGTGISTEANGNPTPNANGDTFDDGVQFLSEFNPGSQATVRITPSIQGIINAWLDFNRDGDWYDPGEYILQDSLVGTEGSVRSFSVPSTAIRGYTFARFRFNTAGGLSVKGEAPDGEVEDYMVQIGQGGGGTGPQDTDITSQSPLNKYMPSWSQPAQQIDPQQHTLVDTSEDSLYTDGPMIADDWEGSNQEPVVGLRWWGTFDGWTESYPPMDLPSAFHIGIWTTDANEPVPATLVWENLSSGWVWTFNGTMESDPNTEGQTVFEFAALFSQNEWFHPQPSLGSKYWVSIAAVYDADPGFGWQWMTQSNVQGQHAIRIEEIAGALPGQTVPWPPSLGSTYVTGTSLDTDASFELLTVAPGLVGPGGDLNGDGLVDVHDLSILMALWLNQN